LIAVGAAFGLVASTYLVTLVAGLLEWRRRVVVGTVVEVAGEIASSVVVVSLAERRCCAGVCDVGREVPVVNVKANTMRSSGLDHIKRCALRSVVGGRVMVLKRYRS
jgi:Na+(H+)/acetate symporter ActP